ncbi:MAG: hypothetical protein PHN18_10670 [Sulfurospirillaceae bacterium]|jgi:hypothetical protein|nr:hypothetical protein [Sulfurospirillaceae bacterium]MDD2827396.1 hypothetical protein [Sulfurospirillaceae bacterium]
MQNAIFDDLKVLKDKLNQEEKESNAKKVEALKNEKEKKLQNDFLQFMKNSGIKKL